MKISSFFRVFPAPRVALGATVAFAAAVGGFLPAATASAAGLKKFTIAHVGATCDTTVYIAKTQGFFAEEGLDVDLVLGDWNLIKEGLAFGRIAATQGLVMNYLKPIEQGLDAKFTGGVHLGCLHILAPKNSLIRTAADLKGKRIGVPAIGSSPWVFASRVIGDNGGDIKKDVVWRPFPQSELKLALEKGEVDAIAVADPIAEILLTEGGVKSIVNQGADAPYKDEYCCVVVLSGKVLRKDPAAAAGITRAILKAALWIKTNPEKSAELAVAGKHIGGSVAINASVLRRLDYAPSVTGGRDAVLTAASALQRIKVINSSTDIEKLAKRTFVPLPGVDDAWVKGLKVEKVPPFAVAINASKAAAVVAEDGGAHACCSSSVNPAEKE
ncbi:MAG: ABC transporter substrate-binding protein [Puniceicoccales bacterium]|jgi:NitT/TauT family transport system substrate-binding protein|nr:ABC transporter substrate-binding protein [Puniceicoccales bacterium]